MNQSRPRAEGDLGNPGRYRYVDSVRILRMFLAPIHVRLCGAMYDGRWSEFREDSGNLRFFSQIHGPEFNTGKMHTMAVIQADDFAALLSRHHGQVGAEQSTGSSHQDHESRSLRSEDASVFSAALGVRTKTSSRSVINPRAAPSA